MPEVIDKEVPIVLGNCVRVRSEGGEPDVYVCVQVESNDGKDEYCILLTENELKRLSCLVADNEDVVVFGRIYPKFVSGNNYYCVRMRGWNGNEFVGAFDIGFWKRCFERAVNNSHLCTKKGIITDFLD